MLLALNDDTVPNLKGLFDGILDLNWQGQGKNLECVILHQKMAIYYIDFLVRLYNTAKV